LILPNPAECAKSDRLLGAEVVTADGRIVRASDNENPDLFWALTGGGGKFRNRHVLRLRSASCRASRPTGPLLRRARERDRSPQILPRLRRVAARQHNVAYCDWLERAARALRT
jgi:hypothetical protein